MKNTDVSAKAGQSPPARISVELLIYSDTLSPGEVSDRLGIQATGSAEKGIKVGERTRTQVAIPKHMWQLSSEPHVLAPDLGSHLSWLLSKLSSLQGQLHAIRSVGSTEFRLVGRVWTSGTTAHVRISKPILESLLALDLELQLEFADYGDDE